MAISDPFEGLGTFLAVARRQSFTGAAGDLGVSVQAVSQAISGLERRLGVLLFQRTTRRIRLTEAGSVLLARTAPAAGEIKEAIETLNQLRDRPSGLLRLSISHLAAQLIIEPVIHQMRQAYSDISIDIRIDDAPGDLAASGFDAGIAIGEFVALDMISVKLTSDIAWSVVGAPSYLAARGRPKRPEDLLRHECIRYRLEKTNAIYRWEFIRGRRPFSIDVPGAVTTTNGPLNYALARQGLGLTYAPDLAVREDLASGQLDSVLAPYLPRTPGLHLYFPSRTQSQPKLRAFIDLAKACATSPPNSRNRSPGPSR